MESIVIYPHCESFLFYKREEGQIMNGEAVIKTNEIWKFFMKKLAIAF